MKTLPLTTKDKVLITKASQIIRKYFKKPKSQKIGSALLSKSGKIFCAVSLPSGTGNISVCAEAIALGKAVSSGVTEFECITSVLHAKDGSKNTRNVPPCGYCRELISGYGVKYVILLVKDKIVKVKSEDLLPLRYLKD